MANAGNKIFFCVLLSFLILPFGNTQEKSVADENSSHYRESLLIHEHKIPQRVNSSTHKSEISPAAQGKIDFLINRGYHQVKHYIEYFYDESIYKMVYLNFSIPDSYLYSEYKENGIVYVLIYKHIEDSRDTNPNFYTKVTITDNDTDYVFIKINYFLEYYVEDIWQYTDDGSFYKRKIFY
jgi:hypothetical protein